MKSSVKACCILVCCSLLAGCGFKLRGSQPLAPLLDSVYLSGTEQYSELGRLLHRRLVAQEVLLSDSAALAHAQLRIEKDQFSKRVLSLDAQGRANQYELVYQLGYSLRGQDNSEWISSQLLSISREYFYDPNLVLAKQQEELQLKTSMREQLVEQMLQRIYFSLKKKQPRANQQAVQ